MTDTHIPDWFRTAKPGDEVVYLGGLFVRGSSEPAPLIEGKVYVILALKINEYWLFGKAAMIEVGAGGLAFASAFRPVQHDPLFLSTLTKETTHV